MAPEVYAGFVRGFMDEWNAAQKGGAMAQEGQRDELKRLDRKIGNLARVIGEDGSSAAILSALRGAEARKATLEAELAVAEAPAPRLLPNLAEVYRRKVAALQDALGDEDAAAARERVRAGRRGGAGPLPCRRKGAACDRTVSVAPAPPSGA